MLYTIPIHGGRRKSKTFIQHLEIDKDLVLPVSLLCHAEVEGKIVQKKMASCVACGGARAFDVVELWCFEDIQVLEAADLHHLCVGDAAGLLLYHLHSRIAQQRGFKPHSRHSVPINGRSISCQPWLLRQPSSEERWFPLLLQKFVHARRLHLHERI